MQTGATSWSRLRLTVSPDAADAVASFCLDHGAPGVVTENRDLRRFPDDLPRSQVPRPRRVTVEAFFPASVSRTALRREVTALTRRVSDAFPNSRPGAPAIEAVDPDSLASGWEKGFRPVRIGRRLLVVPPWERPAASERLVLEIEPARAFGTGQHPTTRGCLVAIERACEGDPRSLPRRGLDVGCGSGILSLAMRALGVASVLAIDIDPIACAATMEAARRNRIDGIRTAQRLSAARGRYDLVAANLFAGPLVELAPRLARLLAPAGTLIVAGLLVRQEPSVRRALETAGLRIAQRSARSGWVILVATPRRSKATRSARGDS